VKQVGDRKARFRLAYLAEEGSNDTLSFDLFCRVLWDWEIHPLIRKDQYIGVVYQKGTEVHIAVLPEFRARWAGKWFANFLRSIMVDGCLTTKLVGDKRKFLSFDQRLGFKIVKQQPSYIELTMSLKDLNDVWGE
jgi:GNAT superfamily N-acetyltransferase